MGIVHRCGSRATRFKLGDRVGIAWLRSTCGKCRFCLAGSENLCPDARFTGYHEHGGYAEYTTVRDTFAYALPRDGDAAAITPLLCAGIIGYRALRRADVRPDTRVGLYGIHLSDVPQLNYERQLFHEKTLRSVTANTRQDGRQLLELAEQIPLRPQVTAFRLDQANEALQRLKHDAIAGTGVLTVRQDRT